MTFKNNNQRIGEKKKKIRKNGCERDWNGNFSVLKRKAQFLFLYLKDFSI